MDAPVKEVERMRELWEDSQKLLDENRLDEALAQVEKVLTLEEMNPKSLSIKADILERQGHNEKAGELRTIVKQIKREAWKKKVEAEARGQHEILGEAIRHEKL